MRSQKWAVMSDQQKIRYIAPEEHREHHEFLRDCIPLLREYLDDRRQTREQWEKFRTSFVGAIATSLAVGLVSFLVIVGKLVIQFSNNGTGN